MNASRRTFLASAAGLAFAPAAALASMDPARPETRFATSPWRKLTDADWKKRLPGDSWQVLRHEATERPGTSPLLKEHRKGVFVCAGCGLPLFKSDWKFESGTGWPSFYTAMPGAVGSKIDHRLIVPRKEYHCAQCLGHQGHIFNDGPNPTGLRYCNNGVALRFVPT
jgi:peptide-methionine (R)-S-oxide reductase